MFFSFIESQVVYPQDTLRLTASREYSPTIFHDGDTTLSSFVKIVIPSEIIVSSGNAGNHMVKLQISTFTNDTITIMYKGGSSQPNPTSPIEIENGLRYLFHSASNQKQVGDTLIARGFFLRVLNGSHTFGTTTIGLLLPMGDEFDVPIPDETSCTVSIGTCSNFLRNWDFEITNDCGTPIPEGAASCYWGSISTADYFNSCSTNPQTGVPSNFVGTAPPRSGNGYSGLLSYSVNGADLREYIYQYLQNPLQSGKRYYAEMFVQVPSNIRFGINTMGMYFSEPYTLPSYNGMIPNANAQIEGSTGGLGSWNKVCGSFVANGGENVLTIGNFRTDANSGAMDLNPGGISASYSYIEDVLLTEIPNYNAGVDRQLSCGSLSTMLGSNPATVICTNPAFATPTFLWTASPADPSLVGQETILNPIVSPTQTTVYTLMVSFGGATCSNYSTSITINLNSSPTIVASSLNLCEQITLFLSPSLVGIHTYQWQFNGVDISGANAPTYIATQPGSYNLIIDGTCISNVIVIPANPIINVTATANPITISCGGSSILTATSLPSASAYSWSASGFGPVVGNPINVSPSITTTYVVTATRGTCIATANVTVVVTPSIIPLTATATPIAQCGGSSTLTVTAPSGVSISNVVWTATGFGPVSGNPITVSPTVASTLYTASVITNPGGCVNTTSVNVVNNVATSITVTGGNTDLCSAGSIQLCASTPVCEQLNPGDIAIIGYNYSAGSRLISFVAMIDLPPCVSINFTNRGYSAALNNFVGNGGVVVWNSPGIIAGTEVTISTAGGGGFNLNGGPNNDQIIAYQGNAPANFRFVYALNIAQAWNAGPIPPLSATDSNLPAGLTNGTTAIFFTTKSIFRRHFSLVPINNTRATILTTISTSTNWVANAAGLTNFTLTNRIVSGFAWNPGGATTSCINVTAAGAYTVTYTSPNGCVTTDVQTITSPGTGWATYFGGSGADVIQDMDVDPITHDIVVAGFTAGGLPTTLGTIVRYYRGPGLTINATPNPLTGRDAFVARISADGATVRWINYIGGVDRDESDGIRFDEEGNGDIYLIGTTHGPDFPYSIGLPPDNVDETPFVCKMTSTGTLVWSRAYLDGFDAYADGITVPRNSVASNRFFITGSYDTQLWCYNTDIFVFSLNKADGSENWFRTFGGPHTDCPVDNGNGIVHDALGNVYIAGQSYGPVADGTLDAACGTGGTLINHASFEAPGLFYTNNTHGNTPGQYTDAIGVSYSVTGNLRSWHRIGTPLNDMYDGVAVLPNGNIVYVGNYDYFPSTHPVSTNKILLTKSGSNLVGQEMKLFEGNGIEEGHGIVTDNNGNIYISGQASSTDLYGANPLGFGTPSSYHNAYTGGPRDMYMARLNGTPMTPDWFTYYGSFTNNINSNDDLSTTIAFDEVNGSLYAAGLTNSTNFEWMGSPIPQQSQVAPLGNTDGAIIKFGCTSNIPPVSGNANSRIGLLEKQITEEEIVKEGININLYPNPFVDELSVLINGSTGKEYTVELYDTKGMKLMTISNIKENIPASFQMKLGSGFYIVKIISDNFVETKRVEKFE